jgi:hypothetical protein
MFLTRKRIVSLHLGGNVIRTTADHPFFVSGKGWVNARALRAGDLLATSDGQRVPVEGISDGGEQAIVYSLIPGKHPMLNRSLPIGIPRPILGFAAGTLIRTPNGLVPIEQLRLDDFIQLGPDSKSVADQGADGPDEPQLPLW